MADESAAEKEAAKANRAQERAATRGTQSNPEDAPDEVRYSRDDLLDSAPQLLGVSRHVVAGALASSDRQTFALKQAEKAVNDFLGREVEYDDPEERD